MSGEPRTRCAWVTDDPIYIEYHDSEWGVPVYDDRRLFEMLVLESAQAGLSWLTILRKREGYRRAFANFDPARVARYGSRQIEGLLADASIVRNRQKIEAAVNNARRFLEVQAEWGSFADYAWSFVGGEPLQNAWRRDADIPAVTAESKAWASDLKRRGFKFLGPTVCYAHMQATGMVNDHLVSCFRHRQVQQGAGPRRKRGRDRG